MNLLSVCHHWGGKRAVLYIYCTRHWLVCSLIVSSLTSFHLHLCQVAISQYASSGDLELTHWQRGNLKFISKKYTMKGILCCKSDKQTPNLCPNQLYPHSTQASYTHRKIFIKPPKLVAQPWSIALFDHNRRGYQRGTLPDQHASKYAPERTTGGTYMPHGHYFYFYLIIFLLSIWDCIWLSS